MKFTKKPVTIDQSFLTTIDRLRTAQTKVDEMRLWFFENIPDLKPQVGFETQFPVQSEDKTFTHLWKITNVESFKKISYNWKYEEYPCDSFVTFKLTENTKVVNLDLSMKVVEDFPDGIREYKRESCIGGWNYFISGNLINY